MSAGQDCVSLQAHTQIHAGVFECIWLSVCFPYVFYWSVSLFYPSCSLFFSLCTDGRGMMECWRVNLWFPGSWSGFIRSGCDNTWADGPTKRLSYKHRSANKKPSWKKESANRSSFLEHRCGLLVAGYTPNPAIFFPPSRLDIVDIGMSSKIKLKKKLLWILIRLQACYQSL